MEIVTYHELEQKSTLLPLMEQAFGWPLDPLEFEKNIKVDPRLRDSGVGFCAIIEGKTIAYVGVMDLATRTVNGKVEKAGGICSVATLPGHTRKGICTALMNRAHEHFLERGYRFSLLTTSPTIVAHALYEKLGYFDVISFPGVYKVKEKASKQETVQGKEVSKLNLASMLEIYRDYVKNKTGLVARDETYMKMLVKTYEITHKECITTEKGYLIFKKDKKQIRIRELVAHDNKEMSKLIGIAEDKAQDVIYSKVVVDPTLREAYQARGFMVLDSGHGVLMAKELTAHASFKEAYGNRFHMNALDYF